MAGLFEDDAEVYGTKKPKKSAEKSDGNKRAKSVGARILEKVEGKADLVGAAGGGKIIDFALVDVSPVRKRKKVKKQDDGKLLPPIDYVKDVIDDDIQSG